MFLCQSGQNVARAMAKAAKWRPGGIYDIAAVSFSISVWPAADALSHCLQVTLVLADPSHAKRARGWKKARSYRLVLRGTRGWRRGSRP